MRNKITSEERERVVGWRGGGEPRLLCARAEMETIPLFFEAVFFFRIGGMIENELRKFEIV